MDGRIGWIGNWCTLNTNIFLAVSKCPAAGQGLEWTKLPSSQNSQRTPRRNVLRSRVFVVCSEMLCDSKSYFGLICSGLILRACTFRRGCHVLDCDR